MKFGLKNCHYVKAVLDQDNEVTFSEPVAIPGAVSLVLDPVGEMETFFADDLVYYVAAANCGYAGELELALVPDHFRKEILKEWEDVNGVLVERADEETEHFALLFEFAGDVRKIRHCLYFCSAARPGVSSRTVAGRTGSGARRVQTDRLRLVAAPLPNGIVKVKTGANMAAAVYEGWFSAVYEAEI